MKKLAYSAILSISVFLLSCEKNNDKIKQELEKALPVIQVTSMGLVRQVGPFLPTDVIEVTYGGAVTNATAGTFDFAWYTVPATGAVSTLVDSVHFDKWTAAASSANGNNAVTTQLLPTTYPNTSVISGQLLLRLNKLVATRAYSLRLYARTAGGNTSTTSVTRFVTMK